MEANRGDPREYDDDMANGMINDEIEDIESDEDNQQIYAYQQQMNQQKTNSTKKVLVPGLALGGVESAGYGIKGTGNGPPKVGGLNLGAIGQNQNEKKEIPYGFSLGKPPGTRENTQEAQTQG